MPERYFSIWCPSWPVTSAWINLGNRPDVPTVIFDRDDNKAHVIATCPKGYSAGIRRSMRQRSAQAIAPDAHFSVSNIVSEAKNFDAVLEVVRDMVPSVCLVRPGRLECNARGPSRYFGGEKQAAIEILNRVVALGIEDVYVGVANTRFASYVGARIAPYSGNGGVYVVSSTEKQTQEFINLQPLSFLDAPQIVSLLSRLGISTLGDIAKMSGGDMLARFGHEGERVHALVTGFEDERDTRAVAVNKEVLSQEYACQDPLVSSEQAAFVAKKLARTLSTKLDENALACSELEIQTDLSSGETCTRTWRVETSAIEQIVASRVLLQCDQWLNQKGVEEVKVSFEDEVIIDSYPRGIIRVVVSATHVMPSHRRQISLFGSDVARDEDVLRSLDRVKALVGEACVVEVEMVGGRMPSESVVFREFSKTLDDLSFSWRDNLFSRDESDVSCALYWPGAIVGKTPMCSFEPGVRARLLDANNEPIKVHATGLMKSEPAFIESAALNPGRQEVTDFAGPWPLEDMWWDETKRRRICRFQILCQDGAFLVSTKGNTAFVVAKY